MVEFSPPQWQKSYLEINQDQFLRETGWEFEHAPWWMKWSLIKRHLAAFHGPLCYYCKKTRGKTLDHKVPMSRGGDDSLGNLVLACSRCNELKDDMTEEEFVASGLLP